jgi:hypothetical protein
MEGYEKKKVSEKVKNAAGRYRFNDRGSTRAEP